MAKTMKFKDDTKGIKKGTRPAKPGAIEISSDKDSNHKANVIQNKIDFARQVKYNANQRKKKHGSYVEDFVKEPGGFNAPHKPVTTNDIIKNSQNKITADSTRMVNMGYIVKNKGVNKGTPKKYAEGSAGVSLTGKPVKKAKPVSPAYLPSDKVKQGGGNPMSMSQGSAKQVANRERKPGMGDYSNTALYGKKSFAKTGVRKFEQGGEVGKNVKASKKPTIPAREKSSRYNQYGEPTFAEGSTPELKNYSAAAWSGYASAVVRGDKTNEGSRAETLKRIGKDADAGIERNARQNAKDKKYITDTIAPKYKKGTMAIKVDDKLNVTEYNGAPVYKSANQKDAPPVEKKTIKAPPLPKTTKPFVIKRSEIKEYSKGTKKMKLKK